MAFGVRCGAGAAYAMLYRLSESSENGQLIPVIAISPVSFLCGRVIQAPVICDLSSPFGDTPVKRFSDLLKCA
jgi:hypothetical protein